MSLNIGRIKKNLRKLRKLLKKAPKRPSPDEIHDLRTQIRRFEATLEAFDLKSKRNDRRLLRWLRRIRKRAGKIRDMDVLTDYTSRVQLDQERDCLVQLLEYFGAERYRRAEQLHALMGKYGAKLRPRLKSTFARLQKLIPNHNKNRSVGRNAAPADAIAFVLKLSIELATPATLNRTNLHAYRLKIKELRYVLEMGDDPGNQEFIDKLGEVKDAIGEWHDWEELIAIASIEITGSRVATFAALNGERRLRSYWRAQPRRKWRQNGVGIPTLRILRPLTDLLKTSTTSR
jgi:CHAD domain-containing protein